MRAAWIFFVFLMLFASTAHAESGAALVAIVTAEPASPLTQRVAAELRSLGLDVIVIKPPAEASSARAPLEQAARSVGAVAAVRLVVSGEGKIEVWVADRVTGKAVVRELDAPANGSGVAALALGTVELFRASLMELHAVEPPHGEVPPSPQIEALALPSPPVPAPVRAALSVGAGASLGGPGVGIAPEMAAGIWIRATDRFGALVSGRATLAPARTTNASGTVDVGWQVLGASVTYDFTDPSASWVPRLALGVAAVHVSATGAATPPYLSAAEGAWSVGPSASAGLAYTIAPSFRLRADAGAALAFPSRDIRTPTTSLGHWGAPAITFAISVELLWQKR